MSGHLPLTPPGLVGQILKWGLDIIYYDQNHIANIGRRSTRSLFMISYTRSRTLTLNRILSKYTIKNIKMEPKEKDVYKFDVELVDKNGVMKSVGVLACTTERLIFEEETPKKPLIVELPFDEIIDISKNKIKKNIQNIKINEDVFMFRFVKAIEVKKFTKLMNKLLLKYT
jgi:hypothetical protein